MNEIGTWNLNPTSHTNLSWGNLDFFDVAIALYETYHAHDAARMKPDWSKSSWTKVYEECELTGDDGIVRGSTCEKRFFVTLRNEVGKSIALFLLYVGSDHMNELPIDQWKGDLKLTAHYSGIEPALADWDSSTDEPNVRAPRTEPLDAEALTFLKAFPNTHADFEVVEKPAPAPVPAPANDITGDAPVKGAGMTPDDFLRMFATAGKA